MDNTVDTYNCSLTEANSARFFNTFITIVFSIVILLGQFGIFSVPDYLIVALCAFFLFVAPKESIYYLAALSFALETWLPFTLIIITAALLKIVKTKLINAPQSLMILSALFVIIQGFAVVTEGLDLVIWVKSGIVLVCLIYLLSTIRNPKEVACLAKAYVVGYLILCTITLMIVFSALSIESVILRFRLGATTLSRWLPSYVIIPNENNLARWSVFTVCICFLLQDRKILKSLPCYFVYIFSTIILLLTQSRSGLLLLIIAFVLKFFLSASNRSLIKKLQTLGIMLIGLIISYIIVSKWFPDLISTILNRFNEEDLSNGRIENFLFYHDLWKNDLGWVLFGFGEQSVVERFHYTNSVHNAIQAYFVYYGIVGALCFISIIVNFIQTMKRKSVHKLPLFGWIPFIVVLIGKLFGAMNTAELLFPIALVGMYWEMDLGNNGGVMNESIL